MVQPYYRRLLEGVPDRDGRRSMLEIGCGPGAFLATLDERWHKYGFDVSRYASQVARTRNPGAHLVVGSADRIPFAQPFDRDPTHVHRRERTFWLSLVGRQLRIESWCGIVRYLLPGGWYLNWPTRALRRHAPAVAIVARR